jgi:NitT/TauT family transport system substrate-binding protein
MRRRPRPIFAAFCFAALAVSVLLAGCHRKHAARVTTPDGRIKVRVGWIGLVCEAPIFVAQEKGFFKEEGLDVELVKTDWDSFQAGMSFERFDATHTLVPYMLKPIEQGLDMKMTGGVHKGCLRLMASVKSDIHKVEDFKGKRIAIGTMGSPPMIFANRVFTDHGLDVSKDVEWLVYSGPESELAIDKGQVDAVACSEPVGSLLLASGKVRIIADQVADFPYSQDYCCAVVVGGAFARRDPVAAAKVTRALLKAAKWVDTNPRTAAKLSVERGYLSSNAELNAAALTKLRYEPGVEACRLGIEREAVSMKKSHTLNASTDPIELARRSWLSLPGVTDEWVKSIQVEHVAGDGPVDMNATAMAVLMGGGKPCCKKCCIGE